MSLVLCSSSFLWRPCRSEDSLHQILPTAVATASTEEGMERVRDAETVRYPTSRVGTRGLLVNVVKLLIEVWRPRSGRIDLPDLTGYFDGIGSASEDHLALSCPLLKAPADGQVLTEHGPLVGRPAHIH